MDAEKERRPSFVRNPSPGDIADARSGGLRPRHHDADPSGLEQRPQAKCDSKVQLRLCEPRDYASRAATVGDLARRRARPDRLGRRIRAQIVTRVDDDHGALCRTRRKHKECTCEDGAKDEHRP